MVDDSGSRCPQCGAELDAREEGASYVLECAGGCGWCAVTTNENTPAFDPGRYDVFLVTELPLAVAAVRVGVAMGRPARDLRSVVSGEEPLVAAADAIEVLHVANTLARRGIGVRVTPEFRWPLPTPCDAA